MKKILTIILTSVILCSCYKSDIYNTIHPGAGKLHIFLQNPTINEDYSAPTDYIVNYNGEDHTITVNKEYISEDLDPNTYMVYVYNDPQYITLDSAIATVKTTNDIVEHLPGHLFFGFKKVKVSADSISQTDFNILQITRALKFKFAISNGNPNRIVSLTATIRGVANQWNCIYQHPIGNPVSVQPILAYNAENHSIEGTAHLLGMNGTEQILTIDLVYEDSYDETITTDISSFLTNFNNIDKHNSMTIKGNMRTPSRGEIGATITDWVVTYEGDIIADKL